MMEIPDKKKKEKQRKFDIGHFLRTISFKKPRCLNYFPIAHILLTTLKSYDRNRVTNYCNPLIKVIKWLSKLPLNNLLPQSSPDYYSSFLFTLLDFESPNRAVR